MKKVFLFSFVFISSLLYSQPQHSWLDIGIKGGWGPTFIVNNNIWNDKKIASLISYGNTFGGKAGWNFNEEHELTVDATYTTLAQKYTIKPSDSLEYKKTISISALNISLLYRHHANGGYMEVGPQFSLLRNARESNSIAVNSTDLKHNYISNYYGAVFGFGSDLLGGENVSLMFGLRMSYGFSDLISSKGGKSQAQSYPLNDTFYNPQYKSYKALHPFSAMLILEFNFDCGYFAKANCSQGRAKFLTF